MRPRPWQALTTLAVVVLAIGASAVGLLRPAIYGEASTVAQRLRAQDAAILLIALPVLSVALRRTVEGSPRGRVVWLGALAFVAYLYDSIAVQAPFNRLFLVYVAIFSVSAITLLAGVVQTDHAALAHRLEGRISRRTFAGVLAVIAVGLAGLWLAEIVPANLSGRRPLLLDEMGQHAAHTYLLDLGIVVPALAIAAILLWRGAALGFTLAGVMLVFGALLAPSLIALTVADVLGGALTIGPGLIAGTVIPPLIAAAFAARYVLAIGSDFR